MDLSPNTLSPYLAQQPVSQEAQPAEPPAPKRGGRDRYLDLLRAIALIRVILYHNFNWSWLPVVFPSLGVMFALAGSLMARSLSRPALGVIRGRLRRLLPPMWLFGAIVITGMVLDGWGPNADGNPASWWIKMAFWILPLSTPPFGDLLHGFNHSLETNWGEQLVLPLWYLRTYLWYLLLSPLMLRAMRRLPWVTLLIPLLATIALNSGYLHGGGRIWDTAVDFTTYGSCWLLGMAHQEGLLKKIPQYLVPSLAPLIMIAGLWYLLTRHVNPGNQTDIVGWPIAQAVWSFGYVALLLHISPSWDRWPPRLERWNGLISWLNSRAVTVYLWHQVALVLSIPLIDRLWSVAYIYDHAQWLLSSQWLPLIVAVPLIALLVTVFGWMEDLAAKRKPRLFPMPKAAA